MWSRECGPELSREVRPVGSVERHVWEGMKRKEKKRKERKKEKIATVLLKKRDGHFSSSHVYTHVKTMPIWCVCVCVCVCVSFFLV